MCKSCFQSTTARATCWSAAASQVALPSPVVFCLVFGILNLVGSSQVEQKVVEFPLPCPNRLCAATVDLAYSGKVFVYIDFRSLQTSYFIYTKGLNYGDLFKTSSSLSDNKECYPIETYADMKAVAEKLGVQTAIPASKGLSTKARPCGLKAFLFNHIGSLKLRRDADDSAVSLETRGIVNPKFKELVKFSPSDYLDVSDEFFLSWYIPQVPGFGTKLLAGYLPANSKGKLKVSFDMGSLPSAANVFYNTDKPPQIVFMQENSGLARHFSNQTYGIILLSIAAATVAVVATYMVVQKRRKADKK